MRTATVVAWVVVLITIVCLSLAPISSDQLPAGIRSGFRMGHAPAYGLLAGLTLPLLLGAGREINYLQAVLVSAACTILLGGAIELIQPWFGRSRGLADFMMNTTGVIAVLVCLSLIRGRVEVRRGARQLFTSE